MKKLYSLIFAVACCLSVAAQVVPQDGQQYVIKNVQSHLYIALATGSDSNGAADNSTAASLQAVGTPFTYTVSGMGFTLQAEDGKWLGMNGGWNVGTTESSVWRLEGTEEAYHIVRNSDSSKGLGMDNYNTSAGIYTDKTPNSKNCWVFEEYTPAGETHTVTASIDGAEAMTMIGTDELGYSVSVLVSTGSHTVVVNYDGEEHTQTFTTKGYRIDARDYSEGYVNILYKDGAITVDGNSLVKPLYVLGIDNVWNPAEPSITVENTFNEHNIYTFSANVEEQAWFCLGSAKGADSSDWDGFNAQRWGAPEPDYELVGKDATANLVFQKDASFKVGAGAWTFQVELGKGNKDQEEKVYSITVTEYTAPVPTGISAVSTQLSGVSYDLLGRRANLQRGIRVENGVKVIR